jgi:Putative zinc dependent peptidase (DUF5700)
MSGRPAGNLERPVTFGLWMIAQAFAVLFLSFAPQAGSADFEQADRMLALLRAASVGSPSKEAVASVLEEHGTDLILEQQNISRRVSREQYGSLLESLSRDEPPPLEPVDASERSRRGLEGLHKDVWPSLRWGTAHVDLLGARLDALRRNDMRSRAVALARKYLPDAEAPEVRISIVMGGRAGAASLSGGEIYLDVLAFSYRAASGTARAYPTPDQQIEFFAHEIHHVGLSRTLEGQRRALWLDPAEARGLDFLTSLVMEGSATYLINAHRDLEAMRRDPLYSAFLARGAGLLETGQGILREILKSSLDAEGYDRATAPLTGNGWHSAGAMMLAAIDASGGLDAVTAVLRDPRTLLVAYDRAARAHGGPDKWTFDSELAARVAKLGEHESPEAERLLPAPARKQRDHRDEERRPDHRPQKRERGAVSEADRQELGKPDLARDPRAQHRADEAEDERDEAAARRPSGNRPADAAREGRDQQVEQEIDPRQLHARSFSRGRGLVAPPRGCENDPEAQVDGPTGPPKKQSREDREIDYLMCSQCGTPCYVFEMEGSKIMEATCLVCGNDEVGMFNIGEEAGPDED